MKLTVLTANYPRFALNETFSSIFLPSLLMIPRKMISLVSSVCVQELSSVQGQLVAERSRCFKLEVSLSCLFSDILNPPFLNPHFYFVFFSD